MQCNKCKRRTAGGAVPHSSNCHECNCQIGSGSGAVPVYCNDCSKKLNRCYKCGVHLNA